MTIDLYPTVATTTFHTFLVDRDGETSFLLDSCPGFDQALTRYAEIAFEDEASVLLGRTVIIRHADTGDVWATGSYVWAGYDSPTHPILVMTCTHPFKVVVYRGDGDESTTYLSGVKSSELPVATPRHKHAIPSSTGPFID